MSIQLDHPTKKRARLPPPPASESKTMVMRDGVLVDERELEREEWESNLDPDERERQAKRLREEKELRAERSERIKQRVEARKLAKEILATEKKVVPVTERFGSSGGGGGDGNEVGDGSSEDAKAGKAAIDEDPAAIKIYGLATPKDYAEERRRREREQQEAAAERKRRLELEMLEQEKAQQAEKKRQELEAKRKKAENEKSKKQAAAKLSFEMDD